MNRQGFWIIWNQSQLFQIVVRCRNHMVGILWTCLDLGSLPLAPLSHPGCPDTPRRSLSGWVRVWAWQSNADSTQSSKWNWQSLGQTVLQADGALECMVSSISGLRELKSINARQARWFPPLEKMTFNPRQFCFQELAWSCNSTNYERQLLVTQGAFWRSHQSVLATSYNWSLMEKNRTLVKHASEALPAKTCARLVCVCFA